jgi:GNAT superfamily N-acetyltransferase
MIVREAKIADAPAIARVNLDTWRTAYRKIVPADYLAQLSYEKARKPLARNPRKRRKSTDFVCVAENDSGQIVGFAAGGCERTGKYVYQGELFAIYILDEYQRQGIGRQLVRTVATKLAELTLNSMLVWVLGDNQPAGFMNF